MNELSLSVKEFASAAGVTTQAVYKQLDKKLQNYIAIVGNRKMIRKSALFEVYGIAEPTEHQSSYQLEQPTIDKIHQQEQPNYQPDEQPKQSETQPDELLSRLVSMIEYLQSENQSLLARLEYMQRLLDQQQQLQLSSQQRLEVHESVIDSPETVAKKHKHKKKKKHK